MNWLNVWMGWVVRGWTGNLPMRWTGTYYHILHSTLLMDNPALRCRCHRRIRAEVPDA